MAAGDALGMPFCVTVVGFGSDGVKPIRSEEVHPPKAAPATTSLPGGTTTTPGTTVTPTGTSSGASSQADYISTAVAVGRPQVTCNAHTGGEWRETGGTWGARSDSLGGRAGAGAVREGGCAFVCSCLQAQYGSQLRMPSCAFRSLPPLWCDPLAETSSPSAPTVDESKVQVRGVQARGRGGVQLAEPSRKQAGRQRRRPPLAARSRCQLTYCPARSPALPPPLLLLLTLQALVAKLCKSPATAGQAVADSLLAGGEEAQVAALATFESCSDSGTQICECPLGLASPSWLAAAQRSRVGERSCRRSSLPGPGALLAWLRWPGPPASDLAASASVPAALLPLSSSAFAGSLFIEFANLGSSSPPVVS